MFRWNAVDRRGKELNVDVWAIIDGFAMESEGLSQDFGVTATVTRATSSELLPI